VALFLPLFMLIIPFKGTANSSEILWSGFYLISDRHFECAELDLQYLDVQGGNQSGQVTFKKYLAPLIWSSK
jgi:hypothetical protein